MKSTDIYEFHLAIREAVVPAGREWPSRFSNWLMLRVQAGAGYWMNRKQNLELEAGTVLMVPPESNGSIRASQINSLSIAFFCVDPTRLSGLMTVVEQTFFRTAAAKKELLARILPPQHPVAAKMQVLFTDRKTDGSLFRLQLLQIFIELFGNELDRGILEPEAGADAKQRLTDFLRTTQTSELLNLSFSELVVISRCTPRHFSRIFREVVGMSFRDKRAELRLSRARDLLLGTNLKIVDVALESGFQSLSLFSLMFARRFGTSPGKWRQQYQQEKIASVRNPRKTPFSVSEVYRANTLQTL
ncbi:MAG TPA: helix-turn-helix domain-containing protein [Verrucomicrobiae bacterium]|jgi:AraC-like DNA-binding protein|nr:helix-turn-helix domain-containing protein [Verrucomicrobiae bacterium]